MGIQYKINDVGERPWGTWKCITVGDKYIAKLITVNPYASLSLQMHDFRSEHWVVVSGTPTITVGDIKKEYKFGQSVDIPAKTKHRLENMTKEVVSVLEVQMGDVLDEKDITRFEDLYDRTEDNTKKMPTCKDFGIGGENKANSSSLILNEWKNNKITK